MDNLNIGDLVIVDKGDLGIDIWIRSNSQFLLFLNQQAEDVLIQWLQKKKTDRREYSRIEWTDSNLKTGEAR